MTTMVSFVAIEAELSSLREVNSSGVRRFNGMMESGLVVEPEGKEGCESGKGLMGRG